MVSGGARGSERSACWTKHVNGNNNTPALSSVPGFIDIPKLSIPTSSLSPPSPPIIIPGKATSSLTIANVQALPSSLASTISTSPVSSDSIASDDDEEHESASEISFGSASSVSVASDKACAASFEAFLRQVFGDNYALEFLKHGTKSHPLSREFAEQVGFELRGAVLDTAHGKTLYCAPSAAQLDREGLVQIMEGADDVLECSGLVIVLDKQDVDLGETLHSLLYVGGQIVAPDEAAIKFSDKLVLVGLDL